MRIRYKLILILLSIALIPVLFVAVFIFSNAKNSLSNSIEKNLENIAEFKAKQIETFFSALRDDAAIAQGYYNIRENLPILSRFQDQTASQSFVNSKKQLDDQLSVLQKVTGFEDIMLADTSGTIVYSSNPLHAQEYGHSLDYYSPGTFTAGEKDIYFTDPYASTLQFKNFKFGMFEVAPMYGFDQKWIGEVIFEINMDSIYSLIQSTEGLGNTGETLVGRKINDKEILILNPLRYDANAALSRKIIIGSSLGVALQNAVVGGMGSGIVTDYRGVEVLAHWHNIKNQSIDWGIVSKIDTNEALAPVNNLRDVIFLVIIVEFLALTGVVFAIAKTISDPIEQLREGTEIIASGNLDYKVNIPTADEVGQLSKSFNKMTSQLKESYENLGQKVRDRTKDLFESEERYRTLVDLSPDAVIVHSGQRVIFANNAAAKLFKANSVNDLIGKPTLDFVHPDSREIVKNRIMEMISLKKGVSPIEEKFLRVDGIPVDVEVVATPIIYQGVEAIQVIARDISDRKKAEDLLRQAYFDLEKFKLAVESSDNHIIITDPDGKIIYVNAAAEKITGYSKDEMIGNRPSLWGGQMRKDFYVNMWHIIKDEKKTFSGEVNNKRKSGAEYVADVHISPVLDEKGNVKFFVGIERDITKEKQLDKAKSEFVSIASHQLRTPLTAIKWVSERFLKTEKLTDKGREYLQDINISMERLSMMVDDLLNISRIEENVVSVMPTKFDLVDFMKHTLSEWEPLFVRKNISREFLEHPVMLEVETDKNILGNILQSLISNAIEYTPRDGTVKIFIMKEHNDYLIAIKDSGIGIPKKEQGIIFQKFGRAGNAKLVKPDGTGLGLYIASQTTKLLGGKIWFESEENRGTTFFVELPFKSVAKVGRKSIV